MVDYIQAVEVILGQRVLVQTCKGRIQNKMSDFTTVPFITSEDGRWRLVDRHYKDSPCRVSSCACCLARASPCISLFRAPRILLSLGFSPSKSTGCYCPLERALGSLRSGTKEENFQRPRVNLTGKNKLSWGCSSQNITWSYSGVRSNGVGSWVDIGLS